MSLPRLIHGSDLLPNFVSRVSSEGRGKWKSLGRRKLRERIHGRSPFEGAVQKKVAVPDSRRERFELEGRPIRVSTPTKRGASAVLLL